MRRTAARALAHAVRTQRFNESNQSELEEEEKEEEIEFLTIALFMTTLFFSQLVLYVSRSIKQSVLPEAGMLLLIGMMIGAIIKNSERADVVAAVAQLTEFDANLFFVVLLPPIIFDSGYTIRRGLFFGNFGVICGLAVFATFISTMLVAVGVYWSTQIFSIYQAKWMECLIFGALISATDPVTVIAVFNRIGVKPLLLILVFGESVLNDAVALVLFRTMLVFELDNGTDANLTNDASAAADFCKILIGSIVIGIFIGLFSAFLFKVVNLYETDMRAIECSIAMLLPFMSYSLAAGLELSGIVSILFTGITMASYTRHNLSEESAQFLHETYSILAHLAETFVFVYLGMACFTGDGIWNGEAIGFGIAGLIACLVSRAIAVFPICMLANLARRPENKITKREMYVLWHSGLRGGMAFALAASSTNEMDNEYTGRVFESATTIIVFATVFLFGGTVQGVCKGFGLIDKDASGGDMPAGHDRANSYDLGRSNSLDDVHAPSEPSPSRTHHSGIGGSFSPGSAYFGTGQADTNIAGVSEIELSELQADQLGSANGGSPSSRSPRDAWSRFDRHVLTPMLVRRSGRLSSEAKEHRPAAAAVHHDGDAGTSDSPVPLDLSDLTRRSGSSNHNREFYPGGRQDLTET